MEIRLPFPPPKLSPNARQHWSKLARAKKAYGAAVTWECAAQGVKRQRWRAAACSITFHPPDRRRRDLDNCLSRFKAGIDAIAKVIGVDDSKWSLAIKMGAPIKGGLVVVELREP